MKIQKIITFGLLVLFRFTCILFPFVLLIPLGLVWKVFIDMESIIGNVIVLLPAISTYSSMILKHVVDSYNGTVQQTRDINGLDILNMLLILVPPIYIVMNLELYLYYGMRMPNKQDAELVESYSWWMAIEGLFIEEAVSFEKT